MSKNNQESPRPQTTRAPRPIEPLRSYGPIEPKRDQPADWDSWADRLTAKLWEAVALSLNIEPDTLSGVGFRGSFDDCPDEFKRRLKIACDHAENGALRCIVLAPANSGSQVRLAEFAEWVSLIGWPPLPARFPRAEGYSPTPAATLGSADAPGGQPPPSGVPTGAWENYRAASILVPGFRNKHGGIAEATRAICQKCKTKNAATVRRDIGRVIKALGNKNN